MKRIAGLLLAATLGMACSSGDEPTCATFCCAVGAPCTIDAECCTNTCTNGVCGTEACKMDGAACTSPLECCTGACSAGCGVQICGDVTFCCAVGAPCTIDAECCTHTCTNGVCAAPAP